MYIKLSHGKMASEVKEDVYITINKDAYQELREYVQHFDGEVSGCGLVSRVVHLPDKDDVDDKRWVEFHIEEVFLPEKQKNSAASTDIEDESLHELMQKLIKEGKDTAKIRLHWHSHADMSVFHSGTDEENYEDFNTGDFSISLVLNKANDVLGRIDYYEPLRLCVSNVQVYVLVEDTVDIEKKIKKQIKLVEDYEKSLLVVPTTQTYYPTEEWKDGKWVPKYYHTEDKSYEQRRKQAIEKLHINERLAEKFDQCTTDAGMASDCSICPHVALCSEYTCIVSAY